MKVIVVSDTHRQNENYFKVVEMHKPDLVVHCGDVEGSEYALENGVGCKVIMVRGNNDFGSDLAAEEEFRACGLKCMVTHGHHYYVSMGYTRLFDEARARGLDVVMCGHTHKPVIINEGGITVINPGSISYPRQEGRKPSYIIMETDRFGDVHYTISYIERD